MRILVVDDQQANRDVTGMMLEKFGIEVHFATSGEEALELCNQKAFNLIFMDVHMPGGMDGVETAEKLKHTNFGDNIVVYGLTSDDSLVNKKRCAAAGMSNFIKKPLKLEEVQKVINKHKG